MSSLNKVIPDSDHISRYCGGSKIENGQPLGIAFTLKEDEEALSVDWLEFLASNRGTQIAKLRGIFNRKMKSLGSTAKFAVLNIGEVITHVKKEHSGLILRVAHDPECDPEKYDPVHSLIKNLPQGAEGLLVGELIAEKVIKTYKAKI